MYQMAIKYTIWQQNRQNCQKIQNIFLYMQDLPKFTQIAIWDLKYTIWQHWRSAPEIRNVTHGVMDIFSLLFYAN
jgi:hypothetical protein